MNLAKYPPSKTPLPQEPEPLFSAYQLTEDQAAWKRLKTDNPTLYELRRANAIAARQLSVLNERDVTYPAWLKEYRLAGQRLAAYERGQREAAA